MAINSRLKDLNYSSHSKNQHLTSQEINLYSSTKISPLILNVNLNRGKSGKTVILQRSLSISPLEGAKRAKRTSCSRSETREAKLGKRNPGSETREAKPGKRNPGSETLLFKLMSQWMNLLHI